MGEEADMFGAVPAPKPRRSTKPKAPGRSKYSWFFALRPSAGEAQHIFDTTGLLLAAAGVTGTRITPDRLHITLEWIGDDIGDDVIDRACVAADTISPPVLDARLDSVKTFPAPSGPCVLLGGDGLDAVRQLRADLARALADHGFKPQRRYEPHMTLCYDRVHRLPPTAIAPIGFHAAEFVLVKSYLGQSRHEVIRHWPLSGGLA